MRALIHLWAARRPNNSSPAEFQSFTSYNFTTCLVTCVEFSCGLLCLSPYSLSFNFLDCCEYCALISYIIDGGVIRCIDVMRIIEKWANIFFLVFVFYLLYLREESSELDGWPRKCHHEIPRFIFLFLGTWFYWTLPFQLLFFSSAELLVSLLNGITCGW